MRTIRQAAMAALTAGLYVSGIVSAMGTARAQSEVLFQYGAQELRSEEGRAEVLERLRRNSRVECRTWMPALAKPERQCRQQVEHQWLAKINNPDLEALASDKPKQSLARR